VPFGPTAEGCYGGPATRAFSAFSFSGTREQNGFRVVFGVCTPNGCE
jgi:hypothetical protein